MRPLYLDRSPQDLRRALSDSEYEVKTLAVEIASLTAQLARCREETVEECRQVNIKEADACIVFAAMSQAPLELVQMHEQAACALKKAAETMRALAPTTGDGR